MGGVSLPYMLLYNWACHARHFWLWLHSYVQRATCIDSWACHPHSPRSFITCEAKKINPDVKRNLIICISIRTWHDISKYLGRNTVKSLPSPITQIPDFPAGVSSLIHVIGHLLRDDTFMSFQQLQDAFNIPIHHFLGDIYRLDILCPPLSLLTSLTVGLRNSFL